LRGMNGTSDEENHKRGDELNDPGHAARGT
jgi:hypothetical protein